VRSDGGSRRSLQKDGDSLGLGDADTVTSAQISGPGQDETHNDSRPNFIDTIVEMFRNPRNALLSTRTIIDAKPDRPASKTPKPLKPISRIKESRRRRVPNCRMLRIMHGEIAPEMLLGFVRYPICENSRGYTPFSCCWDRQSGNVETSLRVGKGPDSR